MLFVLLYNVIRASNTLQANATTLLSSVNVFTLVYVKKLAPIMSECHLMSKGRNAFYPLQLGKNNKLSRFSTILMCWISSSSSSSSSIRNKTGHHLLLTTAPLLQCHSKFAKSFNPVLFGANRHAT